MNTSPIFSIILPTYNRSKMIGFAIESVLQQTFQDFELVIVDDGSTDRTGEIVGAISDPRIRYFFKNNEERSIARNYGLKKSSGKYISFLDSDDYVFSHHLQTAYDGLCQRQFPELLHLAYELQRPSGEVLLRREFTRDNINAHLIYENPLNPASIFIRRDVLESVKFISHRDAIFSEDWCLWLQLGSRFPIHSVNLVSNVVVEHVERSLNTVDARKLEKSLLLVIKTLKEDNAVCEYYRSGFGYFLCECYSLIALHYISVSRRVSLNYLVRSMACYPGFPRRKRFWAILKNLVLREKNSRS